MDVHRGSPCDSGGRSARWIGLNRAEVRPPAHEVDSAPSRGSIQSRSPARRPSRRPLASFLWRRAGVIRAGAYGCPRPHFSGEGGSCGELHRCTPHAATHGGSTSPHAPVAVPLRCRCGMHPLRHRTLQLAEARGAALMLPGCCCPAPARFTLLSCSAAAARRTAARAARAALGSLLWRLRDAHGGGAVASARALQQHSRGRARRAAAQPRAARRARRGSAAAAQAPCGQRRGRPSRRRRCRCCAVLASAPVRALCCARASALCCCAALSLGACCNLDEALRPLPALQPLSMRARLEVGLTEATRLPFCRPLRLPRRQRARTAAPAAQRS